MDEKIFWNKIKIEKKNLTYNFFRKKVGQTYSFYFLFALMKLFCDSLTETFICNLTLGKSFLTIIFSRFSNVIVFFFCFFFFQLPFNLNSYSKANRLFCAKSTLKMLLKRNRKLTHSLIVINKTNKNNCLFTTYISLINIFSQIITNRLITINSHTTKEKRKKNNRKTMQPKLKKSHLLPI